MHLLQVFLCYSIICFTYTSSKHTKPHHHNRNHSKHAKNNRNSSTDWISNLEHISSDGTIEPVPLNPAFREPVVVASLADRTPLVQATGRIIGGQDAAMEEIPYQIAIQLQGILWCGGTIYNKLTIITAAHCFFNGEQLRKPEQYVISAGKFDLSQMGSMVEQARHVVEIIIHPDYNPKVGLSDIALMKLDEPLAYTKTIQPLPIPPQDEEYPPEGAAVISGWGYTRVRQKGGAYDSAGFTSRVQKTEINVFPRDVCKQVYENLRGLKKFVEHYSMLCAGELSGGKDACQGDSGGPLVCKNSNDVKYLCGIVSTGLGCGLPQKPGFFTIVAQFHSWIQENAGDGDEPTLEY